MNASVRETSEMQHVKHNVAQPAEKERFTGNKIAAAAAATADTARAGRREPPKLLFVLPCYNEEAALQTTAQVLETKLETLQAQGRVRPRSAVLFVDDGSKDGTWGIIEELHVKRPEMFHGVKLAHNKGHQNALLGGLMTALDMDADAVVSMDADLQDDPNAVDRMIEDYRDGAEIVYGVRDNRDTDTAFKRGTAEMFYTFMDKMGTETVRDHADYRLMSRAALEALAQYPEENLFLRGIVPSIGLPNTKVYYKRGSRVAGESKYPLRKMVSFAIEGVTSFSTKPLAIITWLGVVAVVVGVAMLVYTIVSVVSGRAVEGWASMMCSLWLLGGMILVALGVIGEYIAKIYTEVKNRPRYIIEKTL